MTNALRSTFVQPRRRVLRALGTIAAVAAAAAVGFVASPGGGRTIAAVDPGDRGAGGEYHAVVPDRIVDSRTGLQLAGPQTTAPTASAPVIDVDLLGRAGVPATIDADGNGFDDQVLAVVVNITVIDPTRQGYLQAYPTGAAAGETSVVNFKPGERVPNSAIIRPGRDGRMSIRMVTNSGVGSAHVAIDVSGWFSTSGYHTNGARTVATTPARIFDSREVSGAAPFRSGTHRELRVRGATTLGTSTVVVPDDPNVTGVIVNVTGVNDLSGSTRTFVSLLQEPPADPNGVTTSNLNLAPGQRRANLAIVPVPDDGTLTIFNRNGATHVVIDVVGYLRTGDDPATTTGRVVPLVAPFRALDTRQTEHAAVPLGPARAEDWSFDAFVDDVKIGTDPVGPQQGLFGNLTATDLEPQYPWAPVRTFVTNYPSPATQPGGPPTASNLNLGEGMAVPNLTLMRYGSVDGSDNQVAVYNRNGYVHYLLDVYAVVLS